MDPTDEQTLWDELVALQLEYSRSHGEWYYWNRRGHLLKRIEELEIILGIGNAFSKCYKE
jgi:hypothetical protein